MINSLKKNKKNYADREYDLLKNHHDFLDKSRIKLANSFDKYLLTFTTGTLYLSINFSNNQTIFCNKNILGLGWFILLISISSTLLSIFSSIKSHEIEMDYDKKNMIRVQEYKPRLKRKNNIWEKIVNITTPLGIITFLLGILLLSFVYFNNLNFNQFKIYVR